MKKTRELDTPVVYTSQRPLIQRKFPPRYRTTRSTSNADKTRQKTRQKTLTQIYSPICLSDGDDKPSEATDSDDRNGHSSKKKRSIPDTDSEEDAEWEESDTRRKRRKTPPSKSPRYHSGGRRKRNLPSSGPSQQTLTQAGYVLRRGLDLEESDEDGGLHSAAISEPTGPVQATTPKAAKTSEITMCNERYLRRSTGRDHPSSASSLRPLSPLGPSTPDRDEKQEVESSQTPVETPDRRTRHNKSAMGGRLPLSECSPNPRLRFDSALRNKEIFKISPHNKHKWSPQRLDLPGNLDFENQKPKESRLQRRYTVPDSEDDASVLSSSPEKSSARETTPTSHQLTTYDTPVSVLEEVWTQQQGMSPCLLPHPQWSQLEQREVTQFEWPKHGSFDEPSAQLLQDVRDSKSRDQTRQRSPGSPLEMTGPYASDYVPQSQVSTIGTTSTISTTPSKLRYRDSLTIVSSPPPASHRLLNTLESHLRQSPTAAAQSLSSPSRRVRWAQPQSQPGRHSSFRSQASQHAAADAIQGESDTSISTARPVTFSQLIPESLRNPSHPLIPTWWQGDEDAG